jgi:hypothetical protein
MINPFFPIKQNDKIKSTSKILYIIGSHEDIDIFDYEELLNEEELNSFCKKLYIIPSSMQLLNITHHIYNSKLINGKFLNLIDNNNYNEEEAIVCIWGIAKNYIESYICQYTIHKNLENYFKIIKVNNYLKVNNYYANINRLNLLIDAPECKFWTIKKNCLRNITQFFIKRNFENEKKKLTNKKVLEEINKVENVDHDYLLFLNKPNLYTNIANSLSQYDYYNYIINEKKSITNDEIYNIIENINSLKELYFFVSKLTLTKEYCHLIINNKRVLELLNDNNFLKRKFKQNYIISFIEKYKLMFKYIIGYAWIIFYTEESIKKSHVLQTDRFVFDIDTASLLPSFPFSNYNPKTNPYFSLLLDNEVLDFSNNINSFGYINIPNNNIDFYAISNLTQFENKLNIFINYKYNYNLFNNITWTNLAVGGSVMAACLSNNNPLQYNFNNSSNNNANFEKYIEHFYKDSDIDIMCNCINELDFFKTFFRFFEQLSNNIKLIVPTENIKYKINKKTYLYISSDIIYKLKIKLNLSENEIINNLNNDNIFNEIYKYYLKEHTKYIEKYITLDIFKNNNYNFLFEPNTKENIVIKINEMSDSIHLFNNIKFEISSAAKSNVLRRKIEFFKIKYNSFFSSVSKFHLNVVRSYYNGENVYILPSCITALKTYINMDLKYFAGNTSPYNIIEKYRFRGFGTILNNSEKIAFVEFIINKDIKPNYNIKRIMKQIIGHMYLSNFKYYQIKVNQSRLNMNIQNINNFNDLCNVYCNIFGNNKLELIKFILENTYTININGSINYYKDYITQLIYDKF